MPMTNAPDALLPPSWKICYTAHLDARLPGLIDSNLLPLRPVVSEWLKAQYPAGIFAHQALAIDKVLSGTNACLATATASGKSLAFMTAGLERLVSEPGSRILALYPQKALGNEQQTRWSKALSDLGLPEAGRIDGSINTALRSSILRTSRVVVMTPDVLHAWLLSNITDKDVRTFLKELTLVVVDEVHTYTGVFGSNAAYLFRRLQHAVAAVGGKVQFFAASATIREPQRHLELLFGLPFELIGPEHDSSPRHPLDVYLTEPPRTIDFLSEVTTYLHYLVEKTKHKFIVFVDSRKQTEQIASILSRLSAPAGDETSDDGQTAADPLLSAAVLPYRAGYEEVDRQTI
jgi:DEAD/DEAH box helicase domain-containing protein